MKIKLLIGLMFLSSLSQATTNPDKSVSIGFHVSSESLEGRQSLVTVSGKGTQDTDRKGIDLRIPINQGVTLQFDADHVDVSNRFKGDPYTYQNEASSLSGYRYGFEIRVYLNK